VQQKWRMMLACFPYGGTQRKEITPWAMQAAVWASKQKDIDGGLKYWDQNDTPITMCRNLAVKAALANDIDILIMLDSDMAPDIDKEHPFLPSAFEFIKRRWHEAPTIISAPYCTAGPDYLPVMGLWRNHKDRFEIKSDLYTREEAAQLSGVQPCSLQGTGLMALDMRVFSGFEVGGATVALPPPWFYYEYVDETNSAKASTEDMVFTRNVTLLFGKHGLEIGFVDWDAWAYHVKTQFVGKPYTVGIKTVAAMRQE
jgi:hypothetical protein